MNVAAILAVLNLVSAAVSWLRERGADSWPELVETAVESLIDEAITAGATVEQARELFTAAALAVLTAAVPGIQPSTAEGLSSSAAARGVAALRRRVAALAFARASRDLPRLADATAGVLRAFNAAPVVDVRPEEVRMERVPWGSSSATTEPAPLGSPPLPPSGSSDPRK